MRQLCSRWKEHISFVSGGNKRIYSTAKVCLSWRINETCPAAYAWELPWCSVSSWTLAAATRKETLTSVSILQAKSGSTVFQLRRRLSSWGKWASTRAAASVMGLLTAWLMFYTRNDERGWACEGRACGCKRGPPQIGHGCSWGSRRWCWGSRCSWCRRSLGAVSSSLYMLQST